MRIVAGEFGGRRLLVPKGRDIRPTSDKIRGAIFNSLRSRGAVTDANVLDGFCGTGALGLEALSQGALGCTFIDSAKNSLDLAKENVAALGVENRCQFRLKELAKIGQNTDSNNKFSLVFLDPPYNKNLLLPALTALETGGWLAPEAIVVLESEKSTSGEFPNTYVLLDSRIYGDTKVVTLRCGH
jgi:16S rRNA (guanine966-N2)-methyltransferase